MTVKYRWLLPEGIEWSEATTPRDWSEEKMAAIRAFYRPYER